MFSLGFTHYTASPMWVAIMPTLISVGLYNSRHLYSSRAGRVFAAGAASLETPLNTGDAPLGRVHMRLLGLDRKDSASTVGSRLWALALRRYAELAKVLGDA